MTDERTGSMFPWEEDWTQTPGPEAPRQEAAPDADVDTGARTEPSKDVGPGAPASAAAAEEVSHGRGEPRSEQQAASPAASPAESAAESAVESPAGSAVESPAESAAEARADIPVESAAQFPPEPRSPSRSEPQARPVVRKEYYSISEVSELVGLPAHVLRYWESQFSVLNPSKNRSGNRVYQRKEIKLILLVKQLLHEEKYTVEGAKQKLDQLRRGGGVVGATQQALNAQLVQLLRDDLQALGELLKVDTE
jgi:DNA-binding transcriptional MerR regulator